MVLFPRARRRPRVRDIPKLGPLTDRGGHSERVSEATVAPHNLPSALLAGRGVAPSLRHTRIKALLIRKRWESEVFKLQ